MKNVSRVLFSALAICLVFATPVRAGEKIPNPQYLAWANYKPGTRVRYTQVTDAMGTKSEGEMTQTLVSLTKEKGVIEIKMNMVSDGEKVDSPAQKQEFKSMVA